MGCDRVNGAGSPLDKNSREGLFGIWPVNPKIYRMRRDKGPKQVHSLCSGGGPSLVKGPTEGLHGSCEVGKEALHGGGEEAERDLATWPHRSGWIVRRSLDFILKTTEEFYKQGSGRV